MSGKHRIIVFMLLLVMIFSVVPLAQAEDEEVSIIHFMTPPPDTRNTES